MTFILFLALISAVIYIFIQKKTLSKITLNNEEKTKEFTTKLDLLENQNKQTLLKCEQLRKYEGVLDAEEKASQILKDAEKELRDAQREANKKKEQADIDYQRKISEAESEAQKIAGNAYEAMRKAEHFEKTAKAMKNIIEGYGDQYIIPTHSLLDHLAEDYSHTSAGEDLKRTRERMRSMIKNKTAADCDYVETNRKETAIDFILDAFNGKVETILASVKEDNHGTLSQKIKDAFQTVNANGAAFKNARITDPYLQVRLDELNLACTVQSIKERDKEEQREIKAKLREEEKAAREYEKALREAQKDQETVNKAIEKVKKDLEQASEAKRLVYEEKLKELELRLKEAEEKNKRAQSMAELTKSGHVYIISNIGSFGDDVLKIGMTRRLEPMDRVDELGDASVPFDFDVHAMIYADDAPALEKELHSIFANHQVNKVNSRKEFFRAGIFEVKNAIEKKGIKAQWTMNAEAQEFRESQAIANKKSAA
jgi:hypothetical protein